MDSTQARLLPSGEMATCSNWRAELRARRTSSTALLVCGFSILRRRCSTAFWDLGGCDCCAPAGRVKKSAASKTARELRRGMSFSGSADESVGTIVRASGRSKGGRISAGEKINAENAEVSQRQRRQRSQGRVL